MSEDNKKVQKAEEVDPIAKLHNQSVTQFFYGGVVILLAVGFYLTVGWDLITIGLVIFGTALIVLGFYTRTHQENMIYLIQGIISVGIGMLFFLPSKRPQDNFSLLDTLMGVTAIMQGVMWARDWMRVRKTEE